MKVTPRQTSHLAVTTAVNDSPTIVEHAQRLAIELNAAYVSRDSRSMGDLFAETAVERFLVVRRDRFLLMDCRGAEYHFHPNLAIVRAYNFAKVGSDHFLEAVRLQPGDHVLDCTIGFGAEAILAAMIVGPTGEVVGLESVPELAIVTRQGMKEYKLQQKRLEPVLRRVVVINFDYRDYLKLAPTRSSDVVYFDPFFDEPLERSANSVAPLAAFGNRAPLDVHSVTEARRVARRIVIIKHLKWRRLADEIASQVTTEICGRRSTVAYSIINGFGRR
jgi:16S rRNA (guanine1516-N2)-methyltransferase